MMSEDLLASFYVNYNIPTVSLRIFSCYGNNNKKQVFWELCKQINASNKSEILLQGHEDDTRDFIHINDLLQQLLLILNKNELFDGRAINIANGEEVSIGFIANLIAKEFSITSINFSGNLISGYPSKWVADISDLTKLGYKSSMPIVLGVKLYCDWFKNHV